MFKLFINLLVLLMFIGCSKDSIKEEVPAIDSGQDEPYMFTITNKNKDKNLWLRDTGMDYKPGETTSEIKSATSTPKIIYKLFVLGADWDEYPTDTIMIKLEPKIINKIIIQ